jgi:hypothetical protein
MSTPSFLMADEEGVSSKAKETEEEPVGSEEEDDLWTCRFKFAGLPPIKLHEEWANADEIGAHYVKFIDI